MVNLFIFHRDLRLCDNTTLIYQHIEKQNCIPIFIFPPEQINPKKNKYFSNNSVQFMIESLHELSNDISDYKGKIYFFKGDNLKVIKSIHKLLVIESIGFNIDYTPYAIKRDTEIKDFCNNNNINCYFKEDYPLYDFITGNTNKADGTPYLVYTPFLKHVSTLDIRPVNKFNKFNFQKKIELESIKFYIDEKEIDDFYKENEEINVHGGRSNSLKILSNINKFKVYNKERDYLIYKTTFLSAGLHFNVVSIREVYHKVYSVLGPTSGILRELVFRDFYMNIVYNFPYILQGQIKGKNISYKQKFDNIKWSYNKIKFDKFCNGQTGFPIVDACIRQMNTTGYMVNRGRMVVASFLTKDLHIDWRWGEQYFATKLVDYDPINNSQGWMWTTGNGTDAQPWFRIFNPWTQQQKYDKDCEFILKWIPELKDVPIKDIHNWFKPEIYNKSKNIDYPKTIVQHDEERLETIKLYKNGLK